MRVYVAGPLNGSGNVGKNVSEAIRIGHWLMGINHHPYVPHLSHFMNIVHPRTEEEWLALDLVWLKQCDALLRLPGVSPGADKEVDFALFHNIPVFYGVDEFLIQSNKLEKKINEQAHAKDWRGQ